MRTLLPLAVTVLAGCEMLNGDHHSSPGGARVDTTDPPDWTVDCNGGGDFETLAEAVAAASENQWIEVAPCTYAETLDFMGKSLWIQSSAGPDDTILDARGGYAVLATRGEGDGTALVGFTIEHGGGWGYGAVFTQLSALRLQDVVIRDSSNLYTLIWGNSSDVELVDVSFENVSAYYGSVYQHRGMIVTDGLSAVCDGGSIAFWVAHGSFFFDRGSMFCPGGTALYNENSEGRVHRSTLRGAVVATTDEDHYTDTNTFENVVLTGAMDQTYGTMIFRNSIAWGGTFTLTDVYETKIQASVLAESRCPISRTWTGTDTAVDEPIVRVEYTDFYNVSQEDCDGTTWSGSEGNLAVDPQFTDAGADDYTLQSGSPLIDAGLEDEEYDDPDGTRNDIGIYGGPRSMGGGW